MHQAKLYNTLGCGEDNQLQITHMKTLMWGRDMIFYGVCVSTTGKSKLFQLESIDCREVKWQVFSHHQLNIAVPFPTTDIVSFKIGQSHHRKSATLLTDHFGLTWNYQTLNLQHGDVVSELI
jgi:hypothetical protein